MNWRPTSEAPEGVLVMTKIEDSKGVRNEQTLCRQGHLWFAGGTYMYYTPTHYRELTQIEKLKIKNEEEAKAIQQLESLHKILGL